MRKVNRATILSLPAILLSTILPNTSNATYTTEQCTNWLSTAQSSDQDASGGLSKDEYHIFLTSIEDPSYIGDYFQQYPDFSGLPWKYRALHRAMACNCMRMGEGSECCLGEGAEVVFHGPMSDTTGETTASQSYGFDKYEKFLCEEIAFLISTVEEPVEEVSVEEPVEETEEVNVEETGEASVEIGEATVEEAGETGEETGEVSVTETTEETVEETTEKPVEETTDETEQEPVVGTADTEPPTPTPATSDNGTIVDDEEISPVTTPGYEVSPVEEEVEANTGLGAGAIIGILFAILVLLCGGCFALARQRKMDEEKRLQDFAEGAGEEDHLASFDAMLEKREPLPDVEEIEHLNVEEPEIAMDKPLPEPEIVVAPDVKEKKNDDESDDNSSVWSGDEKEKEAEIIVDEEDDQTMTVGSALAAMGVASTVATSRLL